MLNHIVLMGRLTKDPELRYTGSNVPVVSFRLAVDRDFGNRETGEKQADFIDVVAWRQTAEFVSKYFAKGRMAAVSGRLQSRDWQDQSGNRRTSYEVVADNVYFGDSKSGARDNADTSSYGSYNSSADRGDSYKPTRDSFQNARNSGTANNSGFTELDDEDGDLPF